MILEEEAVRREKRIELQSNLFAAELASPDFRVAPE